MSQPTFYSDGTSARRTDSKHVISVKWLGAIQNNLAGAAFAANNPIKTDTSVVILRKIDSAKAGVAYPL